MEMTTLESQASDPTSRNLYQSNSPPTIAPSDSAYASDDNWGEGPSSVRQSILVQEKLNYTGWRKLLYGGGLGRFFFTTSVGWSLFVVTLALWLGVWQTEVMVTSKISLWSDYLKDNYTPHTYVMYIVATVSNFPYPFTTIFIQMVTTHLLLLLATSFTRLLGQPLASAGFSGMIAPSNRSSDRTKGTIARGPGGIAGGGLFEFDIPVIKQVMPLAVVYTLKVIISNLSLIHTQFQVFALAHTGLLPLSLVLTAVINGAGESIFVILAAGFTTMAIAVAHIRPELEGTPGALALGILSTIFTALYPVQIVRTYKIILASLIPQGESLTHSSDSTSATANFSGSPEEAQAFYRLLHYTSLLSLILFAPVLLVSGELPGFFRACSTFDTFFYWIPVISGSFGYWAVFIGTFALTRATSPFTTTFIWVPSTVILLPFMRNARMPVNGWVGFIWCWFGSLFFLGIRWWEGRSFSRGR